MDPLDLVHVIREGILVVGVVAAPLVLAGFVAAGGIGLLQSSMNLHDPAIGLAPRLIVVGAVLFVTASWMVERLSEYLVTSLGP
jgi:flagellar biosynthesis protein FliQ